MTSTGPEPWWASGVGPDAENGDPVGPDPADPVDAHRAARRGATTDEGLAHGVEVCGVCPICVGLRALGEARPELLAHLTEAGRHLAAAARALLDDHGAHDGSDEGGHDRVTRIDLD